MLCCVMWCCVWKCDIFIKCSWLVVCVKIFACEKMFLLTWTSDVQSHREHLNTPCWVRILPNQTNFMTLVALFTSNKLKYKNWEMFEHRWDFTIGPNQADLQSTWYTTSSYPYADVISWVLTQQDAFISANMILYFIFHQWDSGKFKFSCC